MLPLLLALAAAAPPPPAPEVPVVRVHWLAGSIDIDGRLDEADWREPPTMQGFVQSSPEEGAPSRQQSRVYVATDGEALYVAARLFDTAPDSIVALLSRRDRQTPSDLFAFFIDAYGDRRSGYRFSVTAAGAQSDGLLYNDDFRDDSWDGVWASAVRRDSLGWSLEMRIPLAQLRTSGDSTRLWGVNAGRVIGRYNETSWFVPRPQAASGFVSRFGYLEGMDDISPGQRLEVIPYVTQRAEYRTAMPGDPFRDGSDHTRGIGADLRLGLGSSLQLDATIFPDFGQVEVDPAVVNLSDVEVRLEERRPFFVEGSNNFRFGFGGSNTFHAFGWSWPVPVYFRRIGRPPQGRTPAAEFSDVPVGVDIVGAAKLTGKIGSWSVGSLGAVTQREHARLWNDGIESTEEIEPAAFYGIGRVERDFAGGRHGLGFLTTVVRRDPGDGAIADQVNDAAMLFGVDGWIGFDARRSWVLSAWGATGRISGTPARMRSVQGSSTHYFQRPDTEHVSFDPEATSLAGSYLRLSLNKQHGSTLFNVGLGGVSPGFNANDMGFQSRADMIPVYVMSGYRWTRPNRWRQTAMVRAAAYSVWDFGGLVTNRGIWHASNVTFRNFSNAALSVSAETSADDPRATRGGPVMHVPGGVSVSGNWSSDSRKPLIVSLAGSVHRYDHPTPTWSAAAGLSWRPATNVTIGFSPSYSVSRLAAQYLRVAVDPLATATYGRRYLFGEMEQHSLSASFRLDWIFTPKLSLELYAQPLATTVRYDAIRELLTPGTFDFRDFGTEGSTIDRRRGIVDPDGAGPAPAITIGQPDFSFTSLRGNAVFRWEYAPGSTLFLVWTQDRSVFEPDSRFRPFDGFGRLGEATNGRNVLMAKLSYWVG